MKSFLCIFVISFCFCIPVFERVLLLYKPNLGNWVVTSVLISLEVEPEWFFWFCKSLGSLCQPAALSCIVIRESQTGTLCHQLLVLLHLSHSQSLSCWVISSSSCFPCLSFPRMVLNAGKEALLPGAGEIAGKALDTLMTLPWNGCKTERWAPGKPNSFLSLLTACLGQGFMHLLGWGFIGESGQNSTQDYREKAEGKDFQSQV